MMQWKPISPFEPITASSPPSGAAWITQIKWDGVRMLLYYDGQETRLFNRRMNERTVQYPELHDIQAFCHADSVILDGEIIAFDESKPSFHEVMRRDSLKQAQKIFQAISQVPVTYMIFDILFYNGDWVTDRTLADRQKLLDLIIQPRGNVQLVQSFPDGEALFRLMKQHRMEGVIYKDLSSTYSMNGKDGRWRKHKVMNDLYAVVGGVTFRGKTVNALLLGVYTQQHELVYIGHAGAGRLTHKDWLSITEKVLKIQAAHKPFINDPERSKDAMWVKQEITVKVEYLEFTPRGTMRHPSIQAIVEMDPSDCSVEQYQR